MKKAISLLLTTVIIFLMMSSGLVYAEKNTEFEYHNNYNAGYYSQFDDVIVDYAWIVAEAIYTDVKNRVVHHYALYFNEANPWTLESAKNMCDYDSSIKNVDIHLLTITSEKELELINLAFPNIKAWCGANFGQELSWVTNEPFDYDLVNIEFGEPLTEANCVAALIENGNCSLFNLFPNNTLKYFIAEYEEKIENAQISINAMQNADGIKIKYIDAMREEKLSINVTNLPEGTVPEIEVSFDKDDFIEVGELKEVPAIQTEATGIAKSYELSIKGIQKGTVKVTANLKGEKDVSDTAEIVIRSPRVFNNNIELIFGKTLPYIKNDRMFVGAEKFFGLVGGSAQENGNAVVGTHNDTRFIYESGQNYVSVNETGATVENIPVNQDTAEGEKIYIPLRFTAENYDGYVQWNDDEYAAYITDNERSAYISNVKKYCYDYPDAEKTLYFTQQDAYDTLINNNLYLSYLFMKEYSGIDTSSLSAFIGDVTKKGIINVTALVFNDEMWTRLWNYLKASHSDPTMFVDGIDEVEKEKYKDALKSYIESTHQKRTTDKIVEVIDNVTDPLKSAKGSISAATSPIKLDLKIEASADDLKETRKMLTDLGVSSDLSDVSDYAKNVDNILDEFDTLSAVGTVSDVAGWGFILTDGLSDMMKTLGNYNTMNEYVAELDSMANNTSLPASLREAAKELKAEISENIDDAIRAPLKRMFDAAGEELTSDGLKTIASGTGATVAAQIFAGVSIAKFIGNLTAGVDDVIKNISYVQMWGLLQEAEVEKLNSLASEFNKLYKAEKDIDEVHAAAEKVEESYKRLHNYRLQGEQTYRYLQSGEYAVIDLQSLTGSGDSVEYADNNIKMLNDINFK